MARHHRRTRKERRIKIDHWLYATAFLRIAIILIPQNGYIHPDEFMQSTEILAGKIFHVDHTMAWEFNANNPIRCITIPYFTIGSVYFVMREFRLLVMDCTGIDIISPYFLVVAPRLLMGIFSFLIDYSLYKICDNNKEKYKTRLLVLGTSYTVLVYGTRTFTNTIEMILFACLLYLVAEAQTHTNDVSRKKDYVNYRYDRSPNIIERVKFHKLRLLLASDTYRNGFLVATVCVFGVFNRPTFLIYGMMPTFFWIFRATRKRRLSFFKFHTRMLYFLICCIPSILFNVIMDSFFYGYITWGDIGVLNISITSFVCTPYNFIKYNLNPDNLKEHGLHPRWLHALVNFPLLYGILGVIAAITVFRHGRLVFSGRYNHLPPLRSIKMLMTASFIFPLLVLSIIPHQEPRFLIPMLLPLVYLHGVDIVPDFDGVITKYFETITEHRLYDEKRHRSYLFFKIWLSMNCMMLLFLGFVHQGGVYYAIKYIQRDIKNSSSEIEFHIVTSRIYSLPESWLLNKITDNLKYKDSHKIIPRKKIILHQEGSKAMNLIMENLKGLIQAKSLIYKKVRQFKKYKIYFLFTNTVKNEVDKQLKRYELSGKMVTKFWPHLSMEALPELVDFCFNPMNVFYENCTLTNVWNYLSGVHDLFGLTLYELSEWEPDPPKPKPKQSRRSKKKNKNEKLKKDLLEEEEEEEVEEMVIIDKREIENNIIQIQLQMPTKAM